MSKILIYVLAGLMIASIAVQADIFIKQKQHTDGMAMMGQNQPAQEMIQKIWISKDKIRSESDNRSVIIFLDKKVIYVLNHAQKTYFEMPMSFDKMMDEAMEGQEETEKMDSEEMMKMAQGMMKFKISVSPTSETKKINKWNCKRYNQEIQMGMGPISSEVWATEELKMDYNLYAKFNTAMMATQPGFKDSFEEAMKELKKIKGVPVLTKTTMKMMGMEIKSSQELLEFKEGTAPKGTFEIPANYKKVSMMGNIR